MLGKEEREWTGCEVPVGSSEWPEDSLTAWTAGGRSGSERNMEIKKGRKA